MRYVFFIWIIILGGSCVTKARYESVEKEIKSREKSVAKLEAKYAELEKQNVKLKDSADRLK